jgi:hypothetical protein
MLENVMVLVLQYMPELNNFIFFLVKNKILSLILNLGFFIYSI